MAQLDIDDSVAFEILKQLRAGKWLCPSNDAIAAYVLRTPVDELTVEQYEFARRVRRAEAERDLRPIDDTPARVRDSHAGTGHREIEHLFALDLAQGHGVQLALEERDRGAAGRARVIPPVERQYQRRVPQ